MRHVVDLAPPPFDQVVVSHLRWLLGSDSMADRLLGDEAVGAIVDDQLGRRPSCELSAWLAEAIADEYEPGGKVNPDRIADRVSRRGAQDFEVWFAGLRDAETRCFAVALAVLGGLEHERIARAARRLYERMGKPPDFVFASASDAQYEPPGPFRRTRTQLLQRVRARAEPLSLRGPRGRTHSAQALAYLDPEYPRRILEYVWTDYQIHDLLLDWLGELTENPAEEVCVSAGTALGVLARLSFEFVARNALMPWAEAENSGRRDAVAFALRVAAADKELLESVRVLTSGWYRDRSRPLAQATAARAHGVALGPLDPAAAVDALERLYGIDDIRIGVAVGDSLADLLEDADGGLTARILSGLLDAVGDSGRSAAAQLCFLILADTLITEVGSAAAADGARNWPTLLRLASEDERVREPLSLLWAEVVNARTFHDEAEAVLTSWAGLAESEEAVRVALLKLLRAVGRTGNRSLDILDRYARKWTATDSLAPLPVTSAALLAVIEYDRG